MSDSRRPAPDTTSHTNAVTIVDVARAAGVSHSTVSRVLNNHPYIKDETRERVEAALESLGYVANLRARGLAGGRLGVIGLVVLDLESSYITEVVRSVDTALADNGLDLMLCTTHHRARRETSYVSRLSVGVVDGLIVVLPTDADRYAQDLADRAFPFVLLDHAGTPLANTIISDNAAGTRMAIEHLAGLGHRRIAAITGDLAVRAGHDRLEAFQRAVADLGLDPDPNLVAPGDFLEDGGYRAMSSLLDLVRPPSAVFTSSDTAAIGALRAANERGLNVPGDLSIIGFDDIPEANRTNPPLTTIRQPLAELGRRAVQLLLEKIEEPARTPTHLRLPVKLVERATTGAPSTT